MPFIVVLNKIKYLDISLINHLYYPYAKNHKILMKEINKIPNKWKDILCTWTRRQDSVNCSQVNRLNTTTIKTLMAFLDIEKLILKLKW